MEVEKVLLNYSAAILETNYVKLTFQGGGGVKMSKRGVTECTIESSVKIENVSWGTGFQNVLRMFPKIGRIPEAQMKIRIQDPRCICIRRSTSHMQVKSTRFFCIETQL